MVNIIQDIIKAITLNLKNKFSLNVYSTDIGEAYEVPCFFVILTNIKTTSITTKVENIKLNLDIDYVAKDNKINQLELLNMAENIRSLFLRKPFKVTDNILITIIEEDIEINQRSLTLKLSIDENIIIELEELNEPITELNLDNI